MTQGNGDDGIPLGADPEIDEKPVYAANVKNVKFEDKDTKGGKVLSVDVEELTVYLPLKMSNVGGIQKARRGRPFYHSQGVSQVPVGKVVKVISDKEEGDAQVEVDTSTPYEEWMVAQGLIDLKRVVKSLILRN